MLEKLKGLALRYEDLQAQLSDPAVYGDAGRLKKLNREMKELEPVAAGWRDWEAAERRRTDRRGREGAAGGTAGQIPPGRVGHCLGGGPAH